MGSLCAEEEYCCLGVACEVYNRYHPKNKLEIEEHEGEKLYNGFALVLPPEVEEWLGLASENGFFNGDGTKYSLTQLNDAGYTFAEIADIIESEPKGLFEDE